MKLGISSHAKLRTALGELERSALGHPGRFDRARNWDHPNECAIMTMLKCIFPLGRTR